jgi:predicted outer membrane repeat protein
MSNDECFATLVDCDIINNNATSGGAIGLSNSSGITIIGSTIRNNTAQYEGGAIRGGGYATIEDCTFYGNSAGTGAAGIHFSATTFNWITIERTIISYSPQGEAAFIDSVYNIDISCSDFYGNAGGDWIGQVAGFLGVDGNISEDPLFCDTLGSDFRLSECSPCSSQACGIMGAFSEVCEDSCAPSGLNESLLAGVSTLEISGYPNPFNPQTKLVYTIPETGNTRIEIYDVNGRAVRSLLNESKPVGRHYIMWDGRDSKGSAVASGIYFIRLESAGKVKTGKITLLK